MFYSKNKFLLGLSVGVGAAAAGYYVYKKNQDKIDDFLREQGINMPCSKGKDYESMDLEELVLNKEELEDLIAEKMADEEEVIDVKPEPVKPAPKKRAPRKAPTKKPAAKKAPAKKPVAKKAAAKAKPPKTAEA